MIATLPTTKTRAPIIQPPTRSRFNELVFLAPDVHYIAEQKHTPAQLAALDLYARGFNVGPTKPASKEPFLYKALITTRVYSPDQDRSTFLELFDNGAGLFVVPGQLSMNLAILDTETPEMAAIHAAEFERRNIRPWTVATPSGGVHFWFLVREGELANRSLTDTSEDWELRANECYCLCPPSVFLNTQTGEIRSYNWTHRQGERPPLVSIHDLDWLGAQLHAKQRKQFTPFQSDPFSFLSKRNREFLHHGAPEKQRNDRMFALACDLQANGIAFAEADAIIRPIGERIGLADKEISKAIRSAYSKAREPAKKNRPKQHRTPAWTLAKQFADDYKWHPMTGPRGSISARTGKDVFLALVERSRRDGGEPFRASLRECAQLANTRPFTVQKALAALIQANLIEPCGHMERGHGIRGAGRFKFGVAARKSGTVQESGTSITVPPLRVGFALDVFRDSLAGQTQTPGRLAFDVLGLITGKATSANEIADQLKMNPGSVRRALNKLATWNLASRTENRCWIANAADDETLRNIADQCGTLGKAEARKARFSDERALYITSRLWKAKRFWERNNLHSPNGGAA